jgi:hypothetical protein
MKFYDRLWNWWTKKEPKMHSGKCDLCDKYGMVWLDGWGIFCWDHYCEVMKHFREEMKKDVE